MIHLALCRRGDVLAFKRVRLVRESTPTPDARMPLTIDEYYTNGEVAAATTDQLCDRVMVPVELDMRGGHFAPLIKMTEPPLGGALVPSPFIAIRTADKAIIQAMCTKMVALLTKDPAVVANSKLVLARECLPEHMYVDQDAVTDVCIKADTIWRWRKGEFAYTPAKAFAIPVNAMFDDGVVLALDLCAYVLCARTKDNAVAMPPLKGAEKRLHGLECKTSSEKNINLVTQRIRSRVQAETEYVRRLVKDRESSGERSDESGAQRTAKRQKLAADDGDDYGDRVKALRTQRDDLAAKLEDAQTRLTQQRQQLTADHAAALQQLNGEHAAALAKERQRHHNELSTAKDTSHFLGINTMLKTLHGYISAPASAPSPPKPSFAAIYSTAIYGDMPVLGDKLADTCERLRASEQRFDACKRNLMLISKRHKEDAMHSADSVAVIPIPEHDELTAIAQMLLNHADGPSHGFGDDLGKRLVTGLVPVVEKTIKDALDKNRAAAAAAAAATTTTTDVDVTSMANRNAPPPRFQFAGRSNKQAPPPPSTR